MAVQKEMRWPQEKREAVQGSTPGGGAAEQRLRAALDAAPDAVAVVDEHGVISEFNRVAAALAGVAAERAIGTRLEALAAGMGASEEDLATIRDALRRGVAGGYETHVDTPAGAQDLGVSLSPIHDPDGRVSGAIVVARSLSEQRHAEAARDRTDARTRFVADTSRALAASLDIESTLQTIGDRIVPERADVCVIALCEGERLRPVALIHADPAQRPVVEAIFAGNIAAPVAGGLLDRVMRGGPPLLAPTFEEHPFGYTDSSTRRRVEEMAVRSLVIAPLRVRCELLGVLFAATTSTSGRRLDEFDVDLFQDISDRAAQALDNARLLDATQAAEARSRAAFEHAPIGIALVRLDAEGDPRYAEVNPALCVIAGYTRDELVGRPMSEFTHPDDRADESQRLEWLIESELEEISGEKRQVRADGEVRWVHVRAAPLEEGAFVAQIQDITERRRFQEELEHLASHDPLTGLLNRRRFEEELERALAHVRRHGDGAAVITLDIDNFKHVNDTYGHPVGDELLRACAQQLTARVRTTDQIGRLGGDEFGVILSRTPPADARAVARELLEELRGIGVDVGERIVRVTASAGLRSLEPSDARTAGELLGEADMAMYDAQEQGRDRLSVIRPGDLQPERVRLRMRWSERIRDALEGEGFVLFEQPILHLARSEVDRSELLLRMIGDAGEPIAPGAFLPIAERYGQIQAIDRWVVRHAIELLAERQAAGSPLGMEVNLSGESISDASVVDFIIAEIGNADIDPTALVFEVTETAAIGNLERACQLAQQLAGLGCAFALDDFGAGFGSFSYLKHLPLDIIKIDGEFVRQLPRSRHDQVTVRAIVDIAVGLGKETVAEFVENEPTLKLLRKLGVDRAQGYHIGRPRLAEVRPDFGAVGV